LSDANVKVLAAGSPGFGPEPADAAARLLENVRERSTFQRVA
jgi:hypothetical protein